MFLEKMTINKKIPLGSPVIIDTIKSKYNLNNKLNREIALMPEGIIIGYSDELSEEFLIVKLRSDITVKVSTNELSECTKKFYFHNENLIIDIKRHINNFLNIDLISTGDREMGYVLNPINFIKWMKFTTKDIL